MVFRRVGREDEVLEALDFYDPALVFSTLSFLPGTGGRGRNIHETLERSGYPYVGPSPDALTLSQSRPATLEAWRRSGLPVPDYFCLPRAKPGSTGARLAAARDFPYLLRVAQGSQEVPEVLASSTAELKAGVAKLWEGVGDILVEGLPGGESGREFSVAMIGEGKRSLFLPVERRPIHARCLRSHHRPEGEASLPETLPLPPGRLRRELCELARAAFGAIGLRDYGRLDIVLAGSRLWVLGALAQPPLPDPLFSACAAGAGLTVEGYLGAIALSALRRQVCASGISRLVPPGLLSVLPPGLSDLFGSGLGAGEGAA